MQEGKSYGTTRNTEAEPNLAENGGPGYKNGRLACHVN
jgi:hypothetical protein